MPVRLRFLPLVLAVLSAMLVVGAPPAGVAQTPPPSTFEVIKVAQLIAMINAPSQIQLAKGLT